MKMKTFEEILEYNHVFLEENRRDEIIKMAAEEYASQSKWIRVEDELPKPKQIILVCRNGELMRGFFEYRFKKWRQTEGPYCFDNISHWMPLPEKPIS